MSKIPSVDLNSLITPERSQAFLNDMWNPAYGQGLYFSALHELNEHMFTPIKVGDKWMYSPHAIYDGMSLIDHLNNTFPELKLEYQMDTPYSPPRGMNWIKSLMSAVKSRPVEQHEFLHQLPYDKKFNKELQIFNIEFTEEETAQFAKVNLTSHVLEKVSKLFMRHLSRNQTTRWMIPVNIRGHYSEATLSHMNASYVGVNCSMDDSLTDIKHKLVNKLKVGEQWGYWLMGKIGLIGGKKIILNQTIKSLEKKNSDWFASFSNLGNIGGIASSPSLLILPIVRWHRPLGCVSYIYRNKLNLTLSFHPSLNISEKALADYKNEIYQSVLSK